MCGTLSMDGVLRLRWTQICLDGVGRRILWDIGTFLPKYTASHSEVVIFIVTSLKISNQIRRENSGFHNVRGVCRRAERLPCYEAGADSLRIRLFSPISIIPPLLHHVSLVSHRRCINLRVDSIVKQNNTTLYPQRNCLTEYVALMASHRCDLWLLEDISGLSGKINLEGQSTCSIEVLQISGVPRNFFRGGGSTN
jgi:hypothetical protein